MLVLRNVVSSRKHVGLFDRIGPSHHHLPTFVVRWLPTMRCRKVVNHQQVALLPPVEDHVPVDRAPDGLHLPRRYVAAIAERHVERHLPAQQSVPHHRKCRHSQGMPQQPPLLCAAKCSQQFGREGRWMEDLRVVEPHGLLALRVELEGVGHVLAHEPVLVAALPSHAELFIFGHLFDLGLVARPEHVRPTLHGRHVVRPTGAAPAVRAGVLELLRQ
mmetsp:Transcript_28443/g.80067  ORF Transcript_28443/g.80067 Transcript_28443/m.80067 type:complete len:217 (-) Transcript_28443:1003-1653(-)